MKRILFLFRRDLRLDDNTALISALQSANEVIASFIFTPTQIESNPYRSDCSLQFMIESLEDLDRSLKEHGGKLHLFYGDPEKIVEECAKTLSIEGVFLNRDYTPYSLHRDEKIKTICKKLSLSFHSFDDALLHPPEETVKGDKKPYTIFTPFYHNALKLPVAHPKPNRHTNYYVKTIPFAKEPTIYKKILPKRFDQQKGGREAALKILKKIGTFSDYSNLRNIPSEDKTTHLSPHLKFTTCSIREAYWSIERAFGADSELLRSLYWRDFFTSIAFHFPKVFKGAFKSEYDALHWKNDPHLFHLWCEGKTGFPIVDAGMRELNNTGFMHNRVRMITASFLVKDLHIDWRWGEKYFAQKLLDYDPAVNNGNWQWAASTGCDAQPYFRIFNPWLQGEKFDPDCHYIKKWIPEFKSSPPKTIHSWYKGGSSHYPKPVIDHGKEAKIALEAYKKCKG